MHRQLLRLTFDSQNVGEPIVYQIGVQFGVTTNILRANIARDGGWVVLELVGDAHDVESAEEWARAMGVGMEAVTEEFVD